jgi:beta-glucosidase-like glycosyl hydrolase
MFRIKKDGVPEPTSFPIPLSLAASFNLNLIHRIGNNEKNNWFKFLYTKCNSLSRSSMGSRSREDPFVASQYGYAMIRGLQHGEDSCYLKISVTCKHYDAYDLENWEGVDR